MGAVPQNIQLEIKRIVSSKLWQDTYDISERGQRVDRLYPGLDVGDGYYYWPVPNHDPESFSGVCRIQKKGMAFISKHALRTIIINAHLVVDRFCIFEERSRALEDIIKERHHTNLLCSISHDIRTPLSRIYGATEMLLDGIDNNRYALVKAIQKDSAWLHLMVENILCMTRLEDSRLNKYPEVVEEVIGDVMINHMARREHGCKISVCLPRQPLVVCMDARLIKQVIINLLDNAIRHTKPGHEIAMVVEEDAEGVIFTIRDSGSGIPENNLPHIFKRFFTAATDDTKRGVGLGLPICESVVNAHGGRIYAHNRQDCTGAEFIFILPG